MWIACYYGDSPSFFPVVIVHETTHGFMHRYRSPVNVPNWLDEGAADWMAGKVVRNDHEVHRRQVAAVQRLHFTHSFGGDFFTAPNIQSWQYGIASSMTEFLLESNPKGYRRLINGIKDGKDWQQSLQEAYGVTPAELAFRYGVFVHVPGVQP